MHRLFVLLLAFVLLASACGDDDDSSAATTAAEATTTTEGEEPEEDEGEDEGEDEDEGGGASSDGEVLFEEDFESDTEGWDPALLDDQFVTGEIADGFLTFSWSSSADETIDAAQSFPPRLIWATEAEQFVGESDAIRAETTVSFTRGGEVGLACGIDPSDAGGSSYNFVITSAGVYRIFKFTADGNQASEETLARDPESEAEPGDEPTLPDDPAFEHSDDDSYELAAECRYDEDEDVTELVMEVDGEVVLTAEDDEDPFEAGLMSLAYGESGTLTRVEGFEPFGIAFDDFTLIDLEG
jgi:hypothetical protein